MIVGQDGIVEISTVSGAVYVIDFGERSAIRVSGPSIVDPAREDAQWHDFWFVGPLVVGQTARIYWSEEKVRITTPITRIRTFKESHNAVPGAE